MNFKFKNTFLTEKFIKNPEKDFLNLFKGFKIKFDVVNCPGLFFCFVDELSIFSYNREANSFLFGYEEYWRMFEEKYKMSDIEISCFTKDMICKHLNLIQNKEMFLSYKIQKESHISCIRLI